METALEQIRENRPREVLTVGVVGTFAVWAGCCLGCDTFQQTHPFVDLRLLTHNNRVDMAGAGGLDYAIRFGDGAWHGTHAQQIFRHHSRPCAPALAQGLQQPSDLAGLPLLRSYRTDEWTAWFAAAGLPCRCCGARCLTPPSPWPRLPRRAGGGPVASGLVHARAQGGGWVQPFALGIAPGRLLADPPAVAHAHRHAGIWAVASGADPLTAACRSGARHLKVYVDLGSGVHLCPGTLAHSVGARPGSRNVGDKSGSMWPPLRILTMMSSACDRLIRFCGAGQRP